MSFTRRGILGEYSYRFFRALDLTQRHTQYLDIVVGYRQKYLKDYGNGKKETNAKYIQAMKNVSDASRCRLSTLSFVVSPRWMSIGTVSMPDYAKNWAKTVL